MARYGGEGLLFVECRPVAGLQDDGASGVVGIVFVPGGKRRELYNARAGTVDFGKAFKSLRQFSGGRYRSHPEMAGAVKERDHCQEISVCRQRKAGLSQKPANIRRARGE